MQFIFLSQGNCSNSFFHFFSLSLFVSLFINFALNSILLVLSANAAVTRGFSNEMYNF